MPDVRAGIPAPIGLLIVGAEQFGYLTDTRRYVQDLGPGYRITVVCWDYGLERADPGAATVVYVPRGRGRLRRLARLLRAAHRELRPGRQDLAFIVHLPGSSLLRLAHLRVPMILDIRSSSIRSSTLAAWLGNLMIRLDSVFFRYCTVVSAGTARALGIDGQKVHVVPVGGESFTTRKHTFDGLRLLYVGTLDHRDIPATVRAAGRYARENGKRITYDIVGFGSSDEETRLRGTMEEEGPAVAVTFHGRIPHHRLGMVFERATVGVVYVPQRAEYEDQPPTKLFEYLLSGLPVIATNTRATADVVRAENGELVNATEESFAEGLGRIDRRLAGFDEQRIRSSADAWRWERIVREKLHPALQEALRSRRDDASRRRAPSPAPGGSTG